MKPVGVSKCGSFVVALLFFAPLDNMWLDYL